MLIRKFAAIDIGSNAVRLLIQNVIEREGRRTKFRKSSLIRIPIRLGADAFTQSKISEHNVLRLIKTMKAFKLIMEVNGVEDYWACATSAMREAENGAQIIERVQSETEVCIDLIDGKKEAEIISATQLKTILSNGENALYVDVGGGSTEFTFLTGKTVLASKSFKIGTVRILKNLVAEETWRELKTWITDHSEPNGKMTIIGTGGNINKLHKMSGRKMGQPLSYIWLNSQYHYLQSLSYEDRVDRLGLNPDRADVIIPAAKIFLSAASWSGAKKIVVPKIGLSDGMIKTLYETKNS